MGKRSSFERKANEAYDTPYVPAIPALIPHLPRACYFVEPCAGKGNLIDHLAKHGHTCTLAIDTHPRRGDIRRASAFSLRRREGSPKPRFITNPPFKEEQLKPLIRHLAEMGETWLLLPADLMHNRYMGEFLRAWGRSIVSVGRISWEENGTASKDNFAWFCFDGTLPEGPITFHGQK
jgi:hypothetical protein